MRGRRRRRKEAIGRHRSPVYSTQARACGYVRCASCTVSSQSTASQGSSCPSDAHAHSTCIACFLACSLARSGAAAYYEAEAAASSPPSAAEPSSTPRLTPLPGEGPLTPRTAAAAAAHAAAAAADVAGVVVVSGAAPLRYAGMLTSPRFVTAAAPRPSL